METIIFKAPSGTKAKLKSLGGNLSALLRNQVDNLIHRRASGTAHAKAKPLCGVIEGGPKNVSTSRDYLKQYAKGAH